MRCDATKREHAALSGGDAGTDDASCADPGSVPDFDRCGDEVKAGLRPIVAAGADVCALRYAAMRADFDVGKIVDPGAFADPAEVANGELPGKFHADQRLDVDALSNARAERAQ